MGMGRVKVGCGLRDWGEEGRDKKGGERRELDGFGLVWYVW